MCVYVCVCVIDGWMQVFPESREMIAMCKTEDQLQEVVDFFRERVQDHGMFEGMLHWVMNQRLWIIFIRMFDTAYKWYRRYRKAETQVLLAPPPTEAIEESPELVDDGFMSGMFDDSVYTETVDNGEPISVCY